MSESTKFTPGPWKALAPQMTHVYGQDKGWRVIAVEPMRGVINSQITGMNEANARLISAAPEMYEALKGIADANQKDWDPTLRSAEDFKRWAQSLANHVVNHAEGAK